MNLRFIGIAPLAMLFFTCTEEPWDAQRVCPEPPSTMEDPRDGQTYKTVLIGDQTWMGENLNYASDSSRCYNHIDSNCTLYGRLYSWESAKVACPEGWHLPSQKEWQELESQMGGSKVAGSRLKDSLAWPNENPASTDDCGFSALPGGGGVSYYEDVSKSFASYWWTTTLDNEYWVNLFKLWSNYSESFFSGGSKSGGDYYVRCLQDVQ